MQGVYQQEGSNQLLLQIFLLSPDIYGICIFGNLAPTICWILFLLHKRAFCLIANVNHIPYHLIQTSDLQTSLNLVHFPQLASKFTCIFGYHVLNSSFRLRIQEIHPETSIFYNTITILYAIKLLHHLMHSRIKQDSLRSFPHSRDLFNYTFNTDFSLICFCCFINIVIHLLFLFLSFVWNTLINILLG